MGQDVMGQEKLFEHQCTILYKYELRKEWSFNVSFHFLVEKQSSQVAPSILAHFEAIIHHYLINIRKSWHRCEMQLFKT